MSKKTKPKSKTKLIEVTMTAFKAFYIEAESEDAALESEIVDDERTFSRGDVDWEINETSAREVTKNCADYIRRQQPDQILK